MVLYELRYLERRLYCLFRWRRKKQNFLLPLSWLSLIQTSVKWYLLVVDVLAKRGRWTKRWIFIKIILDWCNWDSFDQQITVFTLKEMRGKNIVSEKYLLLSVDQILRWFFPKKFCLLFKKKVWVLVNACYPLSFLLYNFVVILII